MKPGLNFDFSSMISNYLPRLIIATLAVIIFWIIAAAMRSLLLKYTQHHVSRSYLLKLVARSIYVTLLLIGFITGLGSLGINITAIVTSLGLTGFALGFALKDALGNAIAGFMLLLYEPFKVGDTISINHIKSSKIVDINLRYTQLKNNEQIYLIPNTMLMNSMIEIINS